MAAATAALDALIARIEAATIALHRGEAEDVRRVTQLLGAMGQSFTTTVFAFQQASSVRDGVAFIAGLAEKFPAEAWLGTVAAEQFRRPVGTLRARYALRDTAAIHEDAASLAAALDGAALLRLARTMIVYYAFLLRRLRDLLPFYELSIAFEGHKRIAERVAVSPTGKGVD
ncbi:MAG TPA: hypothetical protein VFW75_05245 [Acetobacteraceae bacterium]|nr:hypothetical protein [Acetobacteraceae bacterium]